MSRSGQEIKLLLTTQANSQIAATRTAAGIFEGTFTTKNGVSKPIRIERTSEGELEATVEAANAIRAAGLIVKPGPDVSAEYAAFSGQWTGTWGYGRGQNWLWIVSIDRGCTAKYALLSNASPPRGFSTAEIKGGELSFLCNRSTGGTCVFSRKGDELWASYSNPAGGINNAVFGRVK